MYACITTHAVHFKNIYNLYLSKERKRKKLAGKLYVGNGKGGREGWHFRVWGTWGRTVLHGWL